ncbi:MAG: ABC transporter permease [Alphaproteobacteria bacterium]|nr:ABC transporter permease [Alphaproteobacteria bacterium]
MLAYILRRIAQLVPVVLVLTVVVFCFVEALPGSIVDTLVGTEGGDIEEARAILRKEYGLDRPIHERYALWLVRVAEFDFGKSLVTRRPISTELLSRIPATIYLAAVGISLSMLIAVPLGTFAAVRRNTGVDYGAQVTSLAGISIPEFWFAILCVLLFSLYLGWLPSSGYVSPFDDFWGSLKFLILPAAAIGFRQAAFTTRLTRSSMLDELSKEYVDTARAMGLPERRVIFRYTLRNAMIPTITISGLQLANLLGGTVVLESIFAWPGIGRAIFEAILQRDYPLIQAGVLVLGIIVVLMNLLVDLTYRLLNPRVKLA